jgi:hypothetical protein
MSIDFKVIYYFDGSGSGCATCNSKTGWYDDRPARPHPNCDCPINMYMGYGWYEIRDISENSSSYTKQWDKEFYFRNDKDFPITTPSESISVTLTKSWSIKAGFEDYVGVGGSGSESETRTVNIPAQTLPPHSELHVYIEINGETIDYDGTKYFVFHIYTGPQAGEDGEFEIGPVYGGTKQEDGDCNAIYD